MAKVMVFVAVHEVNPRDPHEWLVRGGVVTMWRPSHGRELAAGMTHRMLYSEAVVKFKELRDE